MVDFRSSKPHRIMTYHLQSPSGAIATFVAFSDGTVSFSDERDTVELSTADARKVWKALLLCQWQRIDGMDLTLWHGHWEGQII